MNLDLEPRLQFLRPLFLSSAPYLSSLPAPLARSSALWGFLCGQPALKPSTQTLRGSQGMEPAVFSSPGGGGGALKQPSTLFS